MIDFCPYNFSEKIMPIRSNVRMHQIWKLQSNEWFVAVRHIGIPLGVISGTLKGIVRNHLS